MPQLANVDRPALAGFVSKQYGVLTRGQVRACGITDRMITQRLRTGGSWQPLLPGVYLAATGTPTPAQREMAALLYAGPASMTTGPAALFCHGVRAEYTEIVDVLVPAQNQRRDRSFARLHRTARMPGLTRTLERHALMSAHGLIVLHFTPQAIRTQEAVVVENLRAPSRLAAAARFRR
jgi:hypothetical protein